MTQSITLCLDQSYLLHLQKPARAVGGARTLPGDTDAGGSHLRELFRFCHEDADAGKCISGCTALESKLSALEHALPTSRWPTGLGLPTLPSRDPDDQQSCSQPHRNGAPPTNGKESALGPQAGQAAILEQVLLIRQAPALGVSRSLLPILASQHQYWTCQLLQTGVQDW